MLIAQDILDMIDGLAVIKTSVITSVLNDAKNHVLNDGVLEANAMFDTLHKYYTMHLLQIWGYFEDIVTEEVGDVKVTYSKNNANAGDTKWLLEYQRELALVLS